MAVTWDSLRLGVAQGQWDGRKSDQRRGRPYGHIAWVVCERPCAWHERATSLHPDYLLVMTQHLPSCLFHSSTVCLFSGNFVHIHTCLIPSASAGGGCFCLTSSPSFSLSGSLFAFSPTASRSGQASPSRPESPRPPFDL